MENLATVISLNSFRNQKQAKQDRRSKAKAQALEMLKILQGLTLDYETQMVAVANELDAVEWATKHETSALDQIRDDMRRLHNFTNAIRVSIEAGHAATLEEACQEIRQSGNDELIATLDYVLQSDYLGFQAIRTVLEAVEITEEDFFMNTQSLFELCGTLEAAGFSYSISPLATLCCAQALAM